MTWFLFDGDVKLSFFLVDVIIQCTFELWRGKSIYSSDIYYVVGLEPMIRFGVAFRQHNNNFRHQYIDFKIKAF